MKVVTAFSSPDWSHISYIPSIGVVRILTMVFTAFSVAGFIVNTVLQAHLKIP